MDKMYENGLFTQILSHRSEGRTLIEYQEKENQAQIKVYFSGFPISGQLTYGYFYSFDAASINVLVTGSFSRSTQGEGY